MKNPIRQILKSLLAIFVFLPAFLFSEGQGRTDTIPAEDQQMATDTGKVAEDSALEQSYVENSDSASTLFFNGKEDSTALYDSSSLQMRMVPDSISEKLKANGAFWYANRDQPEKPDPQKNGSLWERFLISLARTLGSTGFRRTVWILIVVVFLTIITWWLLQNRISIFSSRKDRAIQSNSDENSENILNSDFPASIALATREGDFRLAIRLHYLWLLKNLSDNSVIEYRADKTNLDYLMQLYGGAYYADFFRLTRNYEYVWYGNFYVDRNKYGAIEKDFLQLNLRLGIKP